MGTSPNSTKIAYYGSNPFLPGIVSPLAWRFHYVFILFAQPDFIDFPRMQNWFSVSPEELASNYGLEMLEQNYMLVSVNGCDDGAQSCEPCPETNMVEDPSNSPEQCTDLCEDPDLSPVFFEGCIQSCERLC